MSLSETGSAYDPWSPEVKRDPHRYFRELRTECPVHHFRVPETRAQRQSMSYIAGTPVDEFWSVLTYGDVVKLLQEDKVFSSKEGPGPERIEPMTPDGMLITADAPAHRRQRRIAGKAFLPRIVRERIPMIRHVIDDLVDGVASQGSCDVMTSLSVPLTVAMIADFLGVGTERRHDMARWGIAGSELPGGSAEQVEAGVQALIDMSMFVQDKITERREALASGQVIPEDFLSAMIKAHDEETDSAFSDDEILQAAHQFLVAGFETTATAIGNGIFLFCTNPSEREKLMADWSLLDNACEEILRFASPVEGIFRTTTCPQTVHGVEIPAGAKVRLVYASANRDAAKFTEPDEFRIDRSAQELRMHVAFAMGPHACIGSSLARTEMKVALETILRRLPGLALDPDERPTRTTALTISGFTRLPVRWDSARVIPRLWD